MNNIKNITIAALCTWCIVSCGDDFLEEKLTTRLSTQYFDTPEGLKEVATGLPQVLRLKYAHEFSYVHTQYGTDEFTLGSDASNAPWNNYSAGLQSRASGGTSNLVQPVTAWDICYVAINTQNTVIDKAPNILAGDPEQNAILGSAYFFRGWTYFFLVQQWGRVPLKLTPSTVLEREFTLSTRQECIQQVIDDFQKAYDLLANPETIVPGVAYKDAAAHFLAKALLFRQSEICSDFNASTRSEDLSKALQLCEEVIAHRPLAPNFVDLFDFKEPDGANEKLPEVILAAQHTTSTANANGRYHNTLCLHFVSIYQNWTGMERDIAGGREYARLRTTNYAMDVYDRVNDSRFWKSFRTTQRLNYPTDRNGDDFKRLNLEMGQLGVMFIINNEEDADRFVAFTGNPAVVYPGATAGLQPPLVGTYTNGQLDTIRCPKTGNVVPNVIPRYRKVSGNSSAPVYGYNIGAANSTWPTCSKHLDGTRPDYSSDNSARDGIIARVAETYLMAAEIKVRQGDFAGALPYINKVRERAAYRNGEDRAKYVDGAQAYTNTTDSRRSTSFWGTNTYYISNNIPETTEATNITVSSINSLPAEDMAIINKLDCSTDFDKMLCFILNERSRELIGEMLRWEDLSRTKTLIKRAYAYNEDVVVENRLGEHHLIRPIPQEFLDGIYKEGHALTGDEKQAMQNPGYN